MKVRIDFEYIAIYEDEKEIVGWHQDEWFEDPSIVPSIATAILLALTDPEDLKKRINQIIK